MFICGNVHEDLSTFMVMYMKTCTFMVWDTVGLSDVQLPYSNEDSLYFSRLVVHCSSCREHEAKQRPEQN